jgi:HSP20 family protein
MAGREKETRDQSTTGGRGSQDRWQSPEVPVTHGSERSRPGEETRGGGLSRGGQWPSAGSLFTSPFTLMRQLSDEMSRVFQGGGLGVGRSLWPDTFENAVWSPSIDVFRRGDDLVVRADLPGMQKDDIRIDVEDNALTLSGERKTEKEEKREGYYWHERSEGSFYRTVPLPENADADRAQAKFENGVLEVTIPAPEQQEQRRGRRIDIR